MKIRSNRVETPSPRHRSVWTTALAAAGHGKGLALRGECRCARRGRRSSRCSCRCRIPQAKPRPFGAFQSLLGQFDQAFSNIFKVFQALGPLSKAPRGTHRAPCPFGTGPAPAAARSWCTRHRRSGRRPPAPVPARGAIERCRRTSSHGDCSTTPAGDGKR